MIFSKLNYFFFTLLVVFLFTTCDDPSDPFPYVYVNETIYIDTQLGNMIPGETKFYNGAGFGGLIIYRETQTTFQVYDRACTYDFQDKCILNMDENFVGIVECPCCGSKFMAMQYGSVLNGPATTPLKEYSAFLQSTNVLRVTN